MKVLIQNLATLEYSCGHTDWTPDPEEALDFVEVVRALDYAVTHGFEDVRVVIKFDGVCEDVELPPVHLTAERT